MDFLPTISITWVFCLLLPFPLSSEYKCQRFEKKLLDGFISPKLSIFETALYPFPPKCYCAFLGWMVLYQVYIWNSLYAQSSLPQLGSNLNVFYWTKCFMASSDAINPGLYQSFSAVTHWKASGYPTPHTILFFIFFLLSPTFTPLLWLWYIPGSSKSSFTLKKYYITIKKNFFEQSLL